MYRLTITENLVHTFVSLSISRKSVQTQKEKKNIFMFDLEVVAVTIAIIGPAKKHNDASPNDVKASPLFSHQSPTLPRETVFPLLLLSQRARDSGRASIVSEYFLCGRWFPSFV